MSMSESNLQEIRDLQKSLNELTIIVTRLQSHLESEMGNNTRQLNDLSDKITKINHRIFGNGSEGILIKLDRIEQRENRRRMWDKAFIGAAAVMIVKIIYDIFSNLPSV